VFRGVRNRCKRISRPMPTVALAAALAFGVAAPIAMTATAQEPASVVALPGKINRDVGGGGNTGN
jgi:hypothetical protein